MRKLLKANFSRLFRDKVFRILMALMSLAGVAIPIIHYLDNKNNGIGWTPDSSFFSYGLLTPVLLAVLTAFFVGTEYSDGTMRNKLIAGHGRRDIYLANLVVCIAAGMLLSLAYLTPHTCLGIPLLGAVQTDFPTLVLYMGLNGALIAAFASIYTLLAMLCQNKAYTVAGCILLVFALLFMGVHIVSALNEPEYYQAYSYTENGMTYEEDEAKNPNYLFGTKRKVYEFLHDFTPGGQVLQLANMRTESPLQLALYDGMILIVTAVCGMMVFKRKDLK